MNEVATRQDLDAEAIQLIKDTVARGTSDAELQLFLYTAKRTGLDPLLKQIHCIKRWNGKEQRETMAIQTGIDGYRLIASRTGELAGISDPVYVEENGFPLTATVTVTRLVMGNRCDFTASSRWNEYAAMKDGKPMAMWAKMPFLMLGKCAEALALRKAFPAELSGLYTHEEMAQADNEARAEKMNRLSDPTVIQRGKEEVAAIDAKVREVMRGKEEPTPIHSYSEAQPVGDKAQGGPKGNDGDAPLKGVEEHPEPPTQTDLLLSYRNKYRASATVNALSEVGNSMEADCDLTPENKKVLRADFRQRLGELGKKK